MSISDILNRTLEETKRAQDALERNLEGLREKGEDSEEVRNAFIALNEIAKEMGAFGYGAETKNDKELLTQDVLNGMLVRTRADSIETKLNMKLAISELRELRQNLKTLKIAAIVLLLLLVVGAIRSSWPGSLF